jgi:hypothetical protein
MKHAGEAALNQIEHLLVELRRIPGLKEKKRAERATIESCSIVSSCGTVNRFE